MAYAEKRGSGPTPWRARWQLDEYTAKGRRKEGHEDGFRTKTAALRYARDREAEIRAGTYIDPRAGQRPLGEWWAQWIAAQDLAPNSIETYSTQWRSHIEPRWGGVAIGSIRGIDIETWLKELRERGVSASALTIVKSVMRGMFDSAVFNRVIRSSPMPPQQRGRRRTSPAAPPREGVIIPLGVVEQILARLERDDERLMVMLALLTGMRWSEIAGMRLRDLHLTAPDGGVAASGYYRIDPVDGALHEDVHSRRYFGPPKSGSRVALGPGYQPGRIVDLPASLVLMLLAYAQRLPATGLGLLFPNRRGEPRQYDTWNTGRWRRVCDGRAASVSATGRSVREAVPAIWPGLKFHDLKHTHKAILNDLMIHAVMQDYRLGHVTPGVPGVYSHPTERMRAELTDRLEEFVQRWAAGALSAAWPGWRAPRPTPISLPAGSRTASRGNMLF